ncbi:hypothetical protein [Rhodobacter lacus]|uniref:Uncharacterized protein n=1 Tax=Rhodobacter lacus TaxID=1641972 RepID=A0ABW5A7I8_9RHOB
MHLVFHLGAHATDEERLIRTLAANPEAMASAASHAPAPGAYRKALREALIALKGRPADPETQKTLRDACTTGAPGPVARLVFSYENFLALPDRAIGPAGLYPAAADKLAPLANLFPGETVAFHLGLINPAVLIAALHARQPGRDLDDMLAGHAPEALRWGPVIARMAEVAGRCGATLTLWCNEDLPLLFPELLRSLADLPEEAVLAGELALVEDLMELEGVKRLRAYVANHPPLSAEQRRKVLRAFLEKFARPEAMEADLPLPGWTEALVARIGAAYEEDVALIAQMPGVTVLRP